jgi:predicted DNA-binding transcriptional regulator YafY
MFTQDEALGLVVGLSLLRAMRSRPFAQALDTAEKKLGAAVSDQLREVLLESQQRIGFEMPQSDIYHAEPTPSRQQALPGTLSAQPPLEAAEDQVVQVFLQGIFTRKAVSLLYRSPYRAEATHQLVAPLGVLWDREYWYLVGKRTNEAEDAQFWRADRVVEIRPQMQVVQPEQGFDIRAYLGRNWLETAMRRWAEEAPVKICLTGQQAARLRQDWYYQHAVFEPLSEAQTLMTFGADDQEVVLELLRWLGPGSELIEPGQWRGLMKEQLAQMLALYSELDEKM